MELADLGNVAWIVVSAFALALTVRVDAKVFGPYFALSSLVSGLEGLESRWWYENSALRYAFLRRVAYPVAFSFILSLIWPSRAAYVWVIGLLGAVLLVWPVVFSGLPRFVSRRDWEVPVLYLSFPLAYALLAESGALIWYWVAVRSGGDPAGWLADQLAGTLIIGGGGVILSGAWSAAVRRLSGKREQREREFYEANDLGGFRPVDDDA